MEAAANGAEQDADSTKTVQDEEEHLPAGQHLLVDLMNVEAAFLNSEQRLADAMVESVKMGGLTLLSYHCHSLLPAGVSCVGVLLESHISFHTVSAICRIVIALHCMYCLRNADCNCINCNLKFHV